ncbi:uncharacterized protein RSE6_00295 [Rhynchosporium secalis]|uniref:Mid2 domain-containing protein n=1 Tax=Rhynchosporium secalis TaxID=38038 RepID=A0A1E1LUV9_RHYSE|nr:uncharacterized protein RSE6_00295 [Rhynchosporium secalis]
MAPLRSDLEAQHRLDIRQNAPQLVPITLTIHRATTTFTTRMNLGEATNSPVSKDVTAFATPIASPDPIVATRSSDPSDNTGVVIGALIGGLAAVLLLIILLWKCCNSYRSSVHRGDRYYDSDTSSSFSSSSSYPSHRYFSGDGFSRRNERGQRVEFPRTTYARRDKRSSQGSSSESRCRSDSTWMRTRRRSRWGNGMLNWVAGTRVRRTRSQYRGRDSVSSGRRPGGLNFPVDD